MPQRGDEEAERRQRERRASNVDLKTEAGWTIAKEIWGTMVGVLPFVVALVIWGARVNERIAVIEMRADMAELSERRRDAEAADQRREVLVRIDRLGAQIEVLQQTVARLDAKVDNVAPRRQSDDHQRRVQIIEDPAFSRQNPNAR